MFFSVRESALATSCFIVLLKSFIIIQKKKTKNYYGSIVWFSPKHAVRLLLRINYTLM